MTNKRGLKTAVPGMRVQLTGYFLRCTGQHAGPDGASKWLIVACECPLCARGKHVAVNEPTPAEELRTTFSDIAPEDYAKHGIQWRHIALVNLQQVGKLPKVADMADQWIQKLPYDKV